ncbi:MAG: hypothetical protein J6Z45_04695, partial [Oscillospiraceae bacterium]|nr:hypothetical protein [Oscillospiraceae bacterium]
VQQPAVQPQPAAAVPRPVDARASNPTPRRRTAAPAAAEPAPAAPDEAGSRYSNPTPTSRR